MKKKIGMRKVGIRVVEKKHFHIGIGGTFSVLADSLEDAITEVHSWFIDAKAIPYVEETDDNEHCDYCTKTKSIKTSGLPDGLQEYADGVARDILHRNYHKSTNGMWSSALIGGRKVFPKIGKFGEWWCVQIDFGCQDDTRNEQYREELYFFQKDGKWTCSGDDPR